MYQILAYFNISMEYHYLRIISKYIIDKYNLVLGGLSKYHSIYRISRFFVLKKQLLFDDYLDIRMTNIEKIALYYTSWLSRLIKKYRTKCKNILMPNILEKLVRINKVYAKSCCQECEYYCVYYDMDIEIMSIENLIDLVAYNFDTEKPPEGIKKVRIEYTRNECDHEFVYKMPIFSKTTKEIKIEINRGFSPIARCFFNGNDTYNLNNRCTSLRMDFSFDNHTNEELCWLPSKLMTV